MRARGVKAWHCRALAEGFLEREVRGPPCARCATLVTNTPVSHPEWHPPPTLPATFTRSTQIAVYLCHLPFLLLHMAPKTKINSPPSPLPWGPAGTSSGKLSNRGKLSRFGYITRLTTFQQPSLRVPWTLWSAEKMPDGQPPKSGHPC